MAKGDLAYSEMEEVPINYLSEKCRSLKESDVFEAVLIYRVSEQGQAEEVIRCEQGNVYRLVCPSI